MKAPRDRKSGEPPAREAAGVHNPLTGNPRVLRRLEEDEVPDEERTVQAPPFQGQGKVFKPKKDR